MSLRSEWGKVACPVLVAGGYKDSWMEAYYGCPADSGIKSIFDNEGYNAAKKLADIQAAIDVCRRTINKAYRARVQRELNNLEAKGYDKPILVAPCKPTSNNVLAKTAAKFLGKKLKLEVDDAIEEVPCPSRKDTERRAKFFQRPEFVGAFQKGRTYILVDDMVTTGATLAELRSHIVRNGGHVGFACSLASCDGMDKHLKPDHEIVIKVQDVFAKLNDSVRDYITNGIGLTPETLTKGEAEYFVSGKGQYALQHCTNFSSPASSL